MNCTTVLSEHAQSTTISSENGNAGRVNVQLISIAHYMHMPMTWVFSYSRTSLFNEGYFFFVTGTYKCDFVINVHDLYEMYKCVNAHTCASSLPSGSDISLYTPALLCCIPCVVKNSKP